MKIDIVVTGMIQENCYLVSDDSGIAAVVDPGDNADKILNRIDSEGLKVEWILLTHGHYDHVGAVADVRNATGAKVAIHEADRLAVRFEADMLVDDGDTIACGDLEFTAVTTPGHTPGCVCYICGDAIFTGDTLFRESIGRTDLAGGDFSQMRKSLIKLRDVPYDDLKVYPGHMEPTTLEYERENNPFIGI